MLPFSSFCNPTLTCSIDVALMDRTWSRLELAVNDRKIAEIMKWMDGAKCFDEICCEFSVSSDELQMICEKVESAGKRKDINIPNQACVVIAK